MGTQIDAMTGTGPQSGLGSASPAFEPSLSSERSEQSRNVEKLFESVKALEAARSLLCRLLLVDPLPFYRVISLFSKAQAKITQAKEVRGMSFLMLGFRLSTARWSQEKEQLIARARTAKTTAQVSLAFLELTEQLFGDKMHCLQVNEMLSDVTSVGSTGAFDRMKEKAMLPLKLR